MGVLLVILPKNELRAEHLRYAFLSVTREKWIINNRVPRLIYERFQASSRVASGINRSPVQMGLQQLTVANRYNLKKYKQSCTA
ncbi:MAG TPA: hypothetical protein V6C91_00350 [Coleofasciculaceae cyanobacterium]